MRKLAKRIEKIWGSPLCSIEWALSICTFVGAFYLFTPLYAIGHALNPSVISGVLTHPLMLGGWGAILVIGSLLVIAGLVCKRGGAKLRSFGWFMVFMARLYQVIAIIIVAGPLPLQWLYPLTLAVIVIILWANARGED